jgi:ABC-2 type transport system ATP-binding protein
LALLVANRIEHHCRITTRLISHQQLIDDRRIFTALTLRGTHQVGLFTEESKVDHGARGYWRTRRTRTPFRSTLVRVAWAAVSDNTVVVEDLTIRYGERTAVDGVSWTARAGEIVAVLGPNGAGKTTTIETLEGYRRPDHGAVRVLDLDPVAQAKQLAPRIGVMLQRNGMYLTMGPRQAVRLFASYYGPRALNPDALLDRVGLAGVAATPWRRLSGGEQQRLSLALALVGRPEVAFLDEPTAMVDPTARNTVRDLIRDLKSDGVTVILTTHDLLDAERLADRVVIMDRAHVVAVGTPDDLTASSSSDGIAFDSLSPFDIDVLSAHINATVTRVAHGNYVVALPPEPRNVATLTTWFADHDIVVGSIRAGRRSLEDVFAQLTSDAPPEVAVSRGRRRRGPR